MTGAAVIRAGFIPLVDCAPLVAASRAGFAASEGLRIDLVRETSWASVRDRIAVRHIDIAHMLGPVPIAAALGLAPLPVRLVVPIALGHGGNTVTVSRALYRELEDLGATADLAPRPAAEAFRRLVSARRQAARA
jgi:NitT/TauT family transport system ATP-binding protein